MIFINNNYRNGRNRQHEQKSRLKDTGPAPFAANLERIAELNPNFRTVVWTGNHLQLTVMSIKPGESVGLEMHPNLDQLLYIVEGNGMVRMGEIKQLMPFNERLGEGHAVIVPAGTWHDLSNTGRRTLKLFSVYAPPQHPRGTVHVTKAESDADEENDH